MLFVYLTCKGQNSADACVWEWLPKGSDKDHRSNTTTTQRFCFLPTYWTRRKTDRVVLCLHTLGSSPQGKMHAVTSMKYAYMSTVVVGGHSKCIQLSSLIFSSLNIFQLELPSWPLPVLVPSRHLYLLSGMHRDYVQK